MGLPMLLFVVSRTRLDRYDDLFLQLSGWPGVEVVLDRRQAERRSPRSNLAVDVERRRVDRRHRRNTDAYLKLGWDVVETSEFVSRPR